MSVKTLQEQLQYPYVLVVIPRTEEVSGLLSAVAVAGRVPLICHTFEEALEVMKREQIQVLICEDHLPHLALDAILKLAKHRRNPIPVIVASRTGEWEEFLRVLRQGAFDYLVLPPRQEEVRRVLELALAQSDRMSGGNAGYSEPGQFSAKEFVLGLGESKFQLASVGHD